MIVKRFQAGTAVKPAEAMQSGFEKETQPEGVGELRCSPFSSAPLDFANPDNGQHEDPLQVGSATKDSALKS